MARRSLRDDDSDDPDDDGIDSGPSEEDIERFSGEEAICPACGAEVWDDATLCPRCGETLLEGGSRRGPMESWFRQRWVLLVILAAVAALLGVVPFLLRRP